jgi:hypothetical protein
MITKRMFIFVLPTVFLVVFLSFRLARAKVPPIFFIIVFQHVNIVEKICSWDVRAGADPQQVTPVLYSHTEVSPALIACTLHIH